MSGRQIGLALADDDEAERRAEMLARLRADRRNGHVVERLFVPLLPHVQLPSGDALQAMRDLRDTLAIERLPPDAVDMLAERLLKHPPARWALSAIASDLIAVTATAPVVMIKRGSLSWSAWCSTYRRTGRKRILQRVEADGSTIELTIWPPRHPSFPGRPA